LSRQITEAFPWDTALRYLLRDRDASYGAEFCNRGRGDGDHGSRHGTTLTLAERILRTRDQFDSPGMSRPHRDLQRAPSAPRPLLVRRLLPNAPVLIFRSTRIAPTLARSCHASSEEPSRSRKSPACITATNVSPPDFVPDSCSPIVGQRPVSRRLMTYLLEDFRSRSEIGRLWFRSLPVSLTRQFDSNLWPLNARLRWNSR
jgi:hypothetical protein